jgi:hypothetical protein
MRKTKWKLGSPEFNEHRIAVIHRRYGKNAFKKFGHGTPGHIGGSPILRAWKQGKLKYVK